MTQENLKKVIHLVTAQEILSKFHESIIVVDERGQQYSLERVSTVSRGAVDPGLVLKVKASVHPAVERWDVDFEVGT